LTYLLWHAFKDDEQHIFSFFVISHLWASSLCSKKKRTNLRMLRFCSSNLIRGNVYRWICDFIESSKSSR
jgi:hypothetical protein